MQDLKKGILLCPYNNCINLPRINLINESQDMKILCSEHENKKTNFEISHYLSDNDKLQTKFKCSKCQKIFDENEFFFYCNECKIFFCIKCHQKEMFHEHKLAERNIYNLWTKCIKHNYFYTKYCKTCNLSLCENCNINFHNNHNIIAIQQKTEKEKNEIIKNLDIQEKTFLTVKKNIMDSLEKYESMLNLKKRILNNYLNYNNNGNAIENLNEIFIPINHYFKHKIDYLNNSENNSFEDRILSLDNYYKMCNIKQENNRNNNIRNKCINEDLYDIVKKHKEINKDLVDIVNVEKDGNCFYRAISYFLYNNEDAHTNIRQQISQKAKEAHKKEPENRNLLEGLDISDSQYINNIQDNGNYAGDLEISTAQELFNINIAAYRWENNYKLSFINFYNVDNNYKKNLLILIFINNNHFQLAYYKKNKEEVKKDNNIGKNDMKNEYDIKNIKKELNNNSPNKKVKSKSNPINFDFSKFNEKNIKIVPIIESKVIHCMIRLSSGNLAIGLSDGTINIYNVNEICSRNDFYEEEEDDKGILLKINNFKGKRISYLYELKDKTLLCASFSKIHHIKLMNDDRDFEYLGSINLSKKELPKRIIELGNELIVCLGEKTFKHENVTRKKCLLKIFNKLSSSSKQQSEDNSFCLFSDCSSINSDGDSNFSDQSEWENVYSSGEEDSYETIIEKKYKQDSNFKLYKNNKNIDNLFICSIFPIEIRKDDKSGNLYEFLITSNKTFYKGENIIQIYGITKNPMRHGFIFYIDKILNDLPCSRMVDSITKLNNEYIGIGLQRYNIEDNEGIAILDINKRIIVNYIRGLSIGLLNNSISNYNFIFFSTNQTKDVKKVNEIRLYKKNNNNANDYLSKKKETLLFQYKSGINSIVELIPSNNNKNNIYYSVSSEKKIFIIKIDNNLV